MNCFLPSGDVWNNGWEDWLIEGSTMWWGTAGKKWFKATGNAVLVAQVTHRIRAGAEDLKVTRTESSTEPVRMGKLSAESRERKKKVKGDLREHSYSGWINKLKGDPSSYLT